MNESSGLKAHMALAPANARYTRKQALGRGRVSSRNRDRLRKAKTTDIRAMAGQKSLFSGRLSIMVCTVLTAGEVTKINNGETINAKTHAEIEMTAHWSMNGVEDLGRPDSKGRIEAL